MFNSYVRLENINKSFGGDHVIKDFSMSISKGEFVSMLGPSGCGKTTLLKLIAGLESPDEGSVFLGDTLSNSVPARKRGAVIVFQDHGLFPHMTVAQNIEFGLAVRKMPKNERAEKGLEMLSLMQIEEKAGAYPHELSGGQKQRVALARACVVEPNVLLLDEPFSNLDAGLKDNMREFVSNLHKKLGITTILVTHDKEEAFMLSHRVGVILNGRLEQMDTPENIYANPETLAVANFIGEANYVNGIITNGHFSCALGDYNDMGVTPGPAVLMLRYDQILLDTETGIPCRILDKKFRGNFYTYAVETASDSPIRLKINSLAEFALGQDAFVRPAERAGRIFPVP